MKKILIGSAMAMSLGGAALAADIPDRTPYYKAPVVVAPVAYNWSGFYIGGNVGYGWAHTDSTVLTATPGSSFPVGAIFTPSRAAGIVGGGQIGYNWQFGNWVLGLEGEFDDANLKNSPRTNSTVNTNFAIGNFNTPWIGMATGRLGYAWSNWMLYAKGGWAWARTETTTNTFNAAGVLTSVSTGKETNGGWTLGGGVEWGLGANWSAKVEYNHIDLGRDTVTRTLTFGTGTGTGLLRSNQETIDLIKFGVNYRFGWAGPILARY